MNALTKTLFFSILCLAACKPFNPNIDEDDSPVETKSMAALDVPDGFLFNTTQNTALRITAVDNFDKTLSNIPIRVSIKTDENGPAQTLFSAQTDAAGFYQNEIQLPTAARFLIVESDYPGIPTSQVELRGGAVVDIKLGSDNSAKDRSGFSSETPAGYSKGAVDDRSTFNYLGTFNTQGVPNYLLPQGDAVSQDVLNMIAASLPEGQPVPSYHPEYIASNVQTNTVLTDSANIWVTFVHEGAGYRNSLGYYAYPTGQTPQTAAAVGALRVIFPNVSFQGSGGGLHTGDKVFLGKFYAGTTIGWFVVPDGWQSGTQTVSDANHPIHYSDKQLNTFTQSQYRNHVVQLADANRELLLLGFEDIDRPGGDNDFNDAIFYISANPFSAIDRTNMQTTKTAGTDTDGDSVPDNIDEAPTDPTWAFRSSTPSLNQMGTLAFEDFFPTKGDYDFNDVVLDYNFEEHVNAANRVVEIKSSLKLRALGASFRNGFAFELPVPASKVASVTGQHFTENYIQRQGNNTEQGQANAVIVAFDNGFSLLSQPGGGFVNTEKGATLQQPAEVQLLIKFTEPVAHTELGQAPYNPFIIVNQERGREVHLAGKNPTALADLSLFGTGDDDSGMGTAKKYLTKNNLPWAINLPLSFDYPAEKSPVNGGYLKFNEWAQGGGAVFPDWYMSTPGYRNAEKLF